MRQSGFHPHATPDRTAAHPHAYMRPAYMRPARWGAAFAAVLLVLAALTAGSVLEVAAGKGAIQPLHLASEAGGP